MRKPTRGKGGQQITVFVTTEQKKVLKAIADQQEFPPTITKVARKLLQDAIDAHSNPA